MYQFDIRSENRNLTSLRRFRAAVSQSYKPNPKAIESVKQLSHHYNQLLIAYNRGLAILWDFVTSNLKQSIISPGYGQSVGLFISPCGTQFT